MYLLGYHFTVQMIDFEQRLLSLFSAYHKLHEQLNEGGNAFIRKLGSAKMAQKGETIHQMAKHLYSGEQQDKVIVEQERFLEVVEQVGDQNSGNQRPNVGENNERVFWAISGISN